MHNTQVANRKIAKNTIVLYLRMILVLFVGLLTSRVVLNTLGVENYGIYNVVGGFVTIFAFLNGAMATATQRFITIELARGNIDRQVTTFSTSVNIHILLGCIIVLLAETIGLWLFYEKLIIPSERMHAAMWVYQISIITTVISIISVPYNALVVAHERMSAFAWMSILDAGMKLLVVYLLIISPFDKLIFYAVLLFIIAIVDRIIYGWYCVRNFPEARYRFTFDREMFRWMSNIAGWSLFGNLAGVGYTQGINVLLNMFFGPVVNAARGVAVTIQNVVSGFATNIQLAINPQITKSYALEDLQRMHTLIYASSKFCFFLLLIFVIPIFLETHEILRLWLKTVPEHSIWFARLTLCVMLVDCIANPMMVSSQAVGRVKVYQSVVGGILLLIVPVAYIFLKMGYSPESVFVVQLVMAIIATVCRVRIVGPMISLPYSRYFMNVVVRILVVFGISLGLSIGLKLMMPESMWGVIAIILLSPIIAIATILGVGLSPSERALVCNKAKSLCSKFWNINSK